jgi:hypothetical protein
MLSTKRKEFNKNTKADLIYKVITNTPKSPPLINLRKILNGEIKFSEDNPALRLSIEDYNLMRKDKSIKELIANLLNIDVNSLTTFCEKDVKILEKYVDLSSMTINEKAKAKTSPIKTLLLSDLPVDALKKITESYKSLLNKYELLDWIPHRKLNKHFVSSNPNAIDFLSLSENKKYIDWAQLSSINSSQKAIEFFKAKIEAYIKRKNQAKTDNDTLDFIYGLSKNPEAFELLTLPQIIDIIYWKQLSANTNPKAIKLLEIKPEEIDWEQLSMNPSQEAIKLLQANTENINWDNLALNQSPEAIELLKANPDKINWYFLSSNPYAINFLIANKNNIDWVEFSKIQSLKAIEILEANPEKICWDTLAGNPYAINLIKERVKYENRLSKEEYDNLQEIINWDILSRNPKAITLIKKKLEKENKLSLEEYNDLMDSEKISWDELSGNPNAIKLLKERKIYEDTLSKTAYDNLNNKINWKNLSQNPSIFTIN